MTAAEPCKDGATSAMAMPQALDSKRFAATLWVAITDKLVRDR
jgi:hypothetical protein